MKDKKIWFKAKRYGWGWYPSTWQGGIITIIFIILAVINSFLVNSNIVVFFINLGLLISGLLIICILKGEKPRWRWGK